jgi:hypothetical protein
MADGLWLMAYGGWLMADGIRAMDGYAINH